MVFLFVVVFEIFFVVLFILGGEVMVNKFLFLLRGDENFLFLVGFLFLVLFGLLLFVIKFERKFFDVFLLFIGSLVVVLDELVFIILFLRLDVNRLLLLRGVEIFDFDVVLFENGLVFFLLFMEEKMFLFLSGLVLSF